MKWIKTPESSNISAIAYDQVSRMLFVEFKGAKQYVYSGVVSSIYQSFMDSPSKGKYFNRYIRNDYKWFQLATNVKNKIPQCGQLEFDWSNYV